jgi:CBS-domain-containing membrane protein
MCGCWFFIRFELEHNSGTLVGVNGDDTLITAFRAMWKHRVSAMPVTDTASKHIIGTLRNTDLLILLDQPNLFNKRRSLSHTKSGFPQLYCHTVSEHVGISAAF